MYAIFRRIAYSNPLATSVARGSMRKKKKKNKNRQNDQVIGFFPVKWRTLGPISRRMQLDGSIRETRISRFEENSCSIIGLNDFPFPFPLIDISEKFQAQIFSPTRVEITTKRITRNLPESLNSFLPCSHIVWWGLKLTIPGSILPSSFHFNLNLSVPLY